MITSKQMTRKWYLLSALCLAPLLLIGATTGAQTGTGHADERKGNEGAAVVQYLEIVTASVEKTCESLADMHGVTFSDPVPELGNARTADLGDGGRIGVRAPMRESEGPVVRPYILVEDIEGAVKTAEAAGAEVAMPPMEIPGQGTFAIYILGGIQHGLWQL